MDSPDYFRRTRLLVGEEAFRAYAEARVFVIGVGGVGSWCAEALVRSGIGHLTLVDDDVVAPSNVNRQAPATRLTLGQPKVEALAARLKEINPAADLTPLVWRYTPEAAERLALAAPVYVIDAIDSVSAKAHLVRRACAVAGVTLFSAMGAAGRTDPTRIRVTKFSRVTGDGLARALRHRFKKEHLFPKRDFRCVWSEEHGENRGTREAADGAANGSVMTVTAAFGLHLAALVLNDISRRQRTAPAPAPRR